jgi:large subunit ribosomal protein L10
MIRSEKEAVVNEVTDILKNAKGIFVTDFKGLNVEQINELREKCREVSVHYKVIKNTLGRLAAKEAGWEEIEDHFQGPSALAYCFDDPSAPARVIIEFAKKYERPTIKVSLFDGSFYGPESVNEIALLPPKDVILAQVVRSLKEPIQGLTGGLNGLLQKLLYTIDAIRDQKSET